MQAVIFCGHLHVLNPRSFLDGCRYLIEVLSLSVSRALPEPVSPSLHLLVSHPSSLPVPRPFLLRPCSSLDLLCSFSFPLATCHGQHLCAAGSVLFCCFSPRLLPLLPDETSLFEYQCFSTAFVLLSFPSQEGVFWDLLVSCIRDFLDNVRSVVRPRLLVCTCH